MRYSRTRAEKATAGWSLRRLKECGTADSAAPQIEEAQLRSTWLSLLAVFALVVGACGTPVPATQRPATQAPATQAPATQAPATDAPATDAPATGAPTGSPSAGEPQQGGTFVFAGSRLAASLDPIQTTDGESFRIFRQIYDRLVEISAGTIDEISPALAESWEGEPADTTYTFHLRQGVTFHDGTPFNADAVVANFERWRDLPAELQAGAGYPSFLFGGFGEDSNMASIVATDESTVTVTLKNPDPQFLYGISLPAFSIVSPAILEATNANDPVNGTFATEATQAGTGPFVLTEYIPDDSATFDRNETYWGPPAYLDRLIIRPIGLAPDRLAALQGGSIQGFDLVSPVDYGTVESNTDFQLLQRASYNSLYIGLNPNAEENSDLQTLAVRQALAYAIDRDQLIETFYGGRGTPADSFLPPISQWYTTEGINTYAYDPDEARRLLSDAGFGEDNRPSVHFWYPSDVTRPYMPDPAGLNAAITQMWEDVGFEVTPDTAIWGADYLDNGATAGNFEAHFLGWTGDWDDPADWYGYHFDQGLSTGGEPVAQFDFNPPGFVDLLATANQALEPDARREAWRQVAEVVHNEVGFITVVHGDTAVAVTSAVNGYQPEPVGTESMAGVWLSQ